MQAGQLDKKDLVIQSVYKSYCMSSYQCKRKLWAEDFNARTIKLTMNPGKVLDASNVQIH